VAANAIIAQREGKSPAWRRNAENKSGERAGERLAKAAMAKSGHQRRRQSMAENACQRRKLAKIGVAAEAVARQRRLAGGGARKSVIG